MATKDCFTVELFGGQTNDTPNFVGTMPLKAMREADRHRETHKQTNKQKTSGRGTKKGTRKQREGKSLTTATVRETNP